MADSRSDPEGGCQNENVGEADEQVQQGQSHDCIGHCQHQHIEGDVPKDSFSMARISKQEWLMMLEPQKGKCHMQMECSGNPQLGIINHIYLPTHELQVPKCLADSNIITARSKHLAEPSTR